MQPAEREVVLESRRRVVTKERDRPPDYDTAVRMKEREELELPSYSEAVQIRAPHTSDIPDDVKACQPPFHPMQLSSS